MLYDTSSNEIHSDILSPPVKSAKNDNTGNETCQLQDRNISKPPHVDIGCEPKSSRSKKSDSGCMEGDRAGSLHSPKLTLSCSLISVISSSSMLEEPNPPSYHTLQSSQDTDGGTSMARHLTKVADSGAQDSNKFPSNIYNHNDSFKRTNKNPMIIDLDEEQERKRSKTPKENTHIPINDIISVSDNYQYLEIIDNYKRTWGIPLQCKLLGGGESTLNSNNAGPISNSASNSSPSSGAGGSNNNNNNNSWPAGHNPATSGVSGNAWNAGGNGNNSTGRQQVSSNTPSNNASHPSNTSQNTGKGGNSSGNQNQAPGQNQSANTGATSWAQAAGKNLPPSSSAANTSPGTNAATSTTANGSSVHMTSPNGSGSNNSSNGNNSTSKQQIEDFKSMRDSLFATDGWGGQHVNQDSSWDVPSSPEPAVTKDGSTNATTAVPWKPNVNNGTDLWEANLRNGGQPPPQAAQKAPWGHTPTTNIGGTWGEDDDGEPSNVWSGSSASVVANPGVQQWGTTPSNPPSMWGNNKKDEWTNSGSGWNDPRDIPRANNGIDPRNSMVDSAHMRAVMDHSRNIGGDSMMPPRGISGRINGSNSADPSMWPGPPPQQPPGPGPHHHVAPTGPPPGPPSQASKMVPPGPAAVSHWKDMGVVGGNNLGRTGMQCPPGPSLQQNRLNTSGLNSAAAAAVAAGIKPDQLWPHNRNGTWGENGPHEMNSTPWGEEKITPWSEPNLSSWNSTQKPKTPMTPGGWTDGEVDPTSWGHVSKMGPKNLTKEIVWASKQFRILSEMNFKKDDIENALRASSMNLEDALEFLNATRAGSNVNSMDGWRRHDIDASPFDHTTNQAYSSHRFNPQQQQLPFAVPPGGNGGGNGGNTPNISSLNPAMVQKILTQQPPPQQASIPYNQSSRTTQNQPSAHQLRMLVQQIQMAVSAGYLNHQILNQPLAPATLILLNSLLQQIKLLQQLQQQATQQSMYPGGQPNKSGAYMTLTVKQQQCKQAIQTLQNQIVTTQTVYMKQQQQSQHTLGAPAQQQGGNVNDFFKPQDPLSIIQASFNDLTMNKDPQMQINPNQSKLNQWKLPNSVDKDDLSCGNEFSRAPGTITKSTTASGSPNLNPLLVQTDSTWSNVSSRIEGWPESVNELPDNKDWGSPASAATNFTDLVPEFEPGKPWKGSQMKSVEDDPNITPGSVVRSPLLSLPTMKDTDIFNTTSNSSTSFENNESNGVYSPLGKVNNGNSAVSKAGWGDVNSTAGGVSDLWGVAPKSRGPPPGLTASKSSSQLVSGPGSSSNGWGSLGSPRWANSQSPWMGSNWLLLRNLTPQIDGSTLKTLCMQHGPLNNFHLFLSHGIALAKYNSRDEASKAQGALNSCVLGNTTIFAESPAENEVHTLLQQLNQQSTSGNNNWSRGGGNNQNKPMQNSASAGSIQAPSDAWSSSPSSSQLWPSALWGTPQSGLETPDPHRATPSSLNSFLPGDLLGGESM